MRGFVLLTGVAVLTGCPSSTPDAEALLVELDAAQRVEVCADYAFSASVFETCGAPIPVRLEPLDGEACADVWMPEDPACSATVTEWKTCQDALSADPCRVQTGTEACDALEACGIHLWSSALGLRGDTAFADMVEADILAVCAVTNDYEMFEITCEDVPNVVFEPSADLCASFGFGGCGDIGQVLDCQLDLLQFGDEACEGFPESCVFDTC